MSTEQKAYWNKDVSRILEIGDSTARKWCLELEKNGYTFIRGHKDSRAFLQHDLNALTYFKDLTKVGSYTLEQAAKLVVDRFKEREVIETATVPLENDFSNRSLQEISDSLKELVILSTKQVELNRVLVEKIEKRDMIIENLLRHTEKTNEERTLINAPETRSTDVSETSIKEKKKSFKERVKNLFKN